MANIISGKELAQNIKEDVKVEVTHLLAEGIKPRLAIVQVGDNPASNSYVKGKLKDCNEVGIDATLVKMDADVTQSELELTVSSLVLDNSIHGILVQLPLPSHINEERILEFIPSDKDVDGFSADNMGRLWSSRDAFIPCTPAGCLYMLKSVETNLSGKQAVIIGRSNIVGKPMAALLLQENMTVTICHSKTKNLKEICKTADVLVVAIGKTKFINEEYIKPGAIVIDIGINRDADGKLCGDVDFASAAQVASAITPVPGGVGLMTRAMLLKNVIKSAKR